MLSRCMSIYAWSKFLPINRGILERHKLKRRKVERELKGGYTPRELEHELKF